MNNNYNFTEEIKTEIKNNLDKLIDNLILKNGSLVQFNYLTTEFLKNKYEIFDQEFRLNHNEIRQNIKKVRHFILKKKEKLKKELENPIFLLNIIDLLDNNDKKIIWDFLHLSFLLYENYHVNKNELIVNTLIEEINKNKEEPINDTNFEDKMKEFMSNITNPDTNIGIENLTDMFKNLTENNGEEPDLQKMLKGLIPNITENQNGELTKEIISDIKDSLSNTSNVDDIFNSTKKLGEKYKDMITSGQINTSEILSSLIGLIDNTELKDELSNIDLSNMPKPEEMLNKLVGDMPENFNIGNMISALSQGKNGNNESEKNNNETILTDKQIKEMEEYYEKIKISN